MKCKKCEKNIPNDSKYCPYCGEKIQYKIEKNIIDRILLIVFISVIILIIVVFCMLNYISNQRKEKTSNDTNIIENTVSNNTDTIEEKEVTGYVGAINPKKEFTVKTVNRTFSKEDMEKFYDIYINTSEHLYLTTKDILYEEFNNDYPNKSKIYLDTNVPMWFIKNTNTDETYITFIVISYKESSLKNIKDSIYYTYSNNNGDYICTSIVRKNEYYYNSGKTSIGVFSDMKSSEGMYDFVRNIFDYTYEGTPDTNLNIFCLSKIYREIYED